jgi:hypothetical protein
MGARKRAPVVVFVIPLVVGLLGFSRVAQGPQFDSYRSVDVFQLLVCGGCVGAAMTGLFFMLLRPRT